jgi:Nif-specific regulatory protein
MRSIRSLLWIGPGEGLAASGVSEAPTLDVTWVRAVDEAFALPPIPFDGAVLEGPQPDLLLRDLRQLRGWRQCPAVLLCLRDGAGEGIRQLVHAGADEVIVSDGGPQPARILDELLERLDRLDQRGRQRPLGMAEPSEETPLPGGVIGCSRAIRDVFGLVERAAGSRATVLVTGETGTGKEMVAKLVHETGLRRRHAFIAINCAAFPETLLESELFGHRKGSFTGADRDKCGHFELAHRGTLFLDEIGETSPALQAKLLRVLQEREVLPVGATRPHPVDVRVIAATNRSLREEVTAGRFREDLYYRLAVFPIRIPPLRERPEDILPLADHFLATHGEREQKPGCRLSAASQRLLQTHLWPGNVRELENEMQRAVALAEPGERVAPKLLSPRVLGIIEALDQARGAGESLRDTLDRVESWLIRRALEHNDGRRARTARKLGVTREGLYKKMKRLNIE